jgi:uncharacterized protein YoxC
MVEDSDLPIGVTSKRIMSNCIGSKAKEQILDKLEKNIAGIDFRLKELESKITVVHTSWRELSWRELHDLQEKKEMLQDFIDIINDFPECD